MTSVISLGQNVKLACCLALASLFVLGIGTASAESINIRDTDYRSPRIWEQVTVDGESRGIVLENVQHVRIHGCAINDVTAAAIVIRRSQDVTIENCTINGANSSSTGDVASVLIEDSSDIHLKNVNLTDTVVGPGVVIQRSDRVTVSGGVVSRGLHDGVVITGGQAIQVDGLVIERQWGNGLVVNGQPTGLELRELTVRDNRGDGVRLSNLTAKAILYNSTIQQNAGYGLRVAWGVRELDVTANAFLLNGEGGGYIAGSCANRFERNVIVAPGQAAWTISLATVADPASPDTNVAGCSVNGNQWLGSDISAGQSLAIIDQTNSTPTVAEDNTFTAERFTSLTSPSERRRGAVLGVMTESTPSTSAQPIIMASLAAMALLTGSYLVVSTWRTLRRTAPAAAQLYYGHRRQWPTKPFLSLIDQWHQRHERR